MKKLLFTLVAICLLIFACEKEDNTGSSNNNTGNSNNDDVDCEQLVANGDSPPNGYYCFEAIGEYNAGRYDEHGSVLGGQTWSAYNYCMSFNSNGTVDVRVDNYGAIGATDPVSTFTTEWAILLNSPSCCEYAPASEEGDVYVIIDIDGDDIDTQFRLLPYNLDDIKNSNSHPPQI